MRHFVLFKQIIVCSLLVCMLLLCGCPMQTTNAIDQGSYAVPSWLAGKWSGVDNVGTKYAYLIVNGDTKGTLKCYDLDSTGNADYTKLSPVILSQIDDKVYASVFNSGDEIFSDDGFYLFLLRRESDYAFNVVGIKDSTFTPNTKPAEMVRFLHQNGDNTDIYDTRQTIRFIKQ